MAKRKPQLTLAEQWAQLEALQPPDSGETPAMAALRKRAELEGIAIATLRQLVPAKAAQSKARVKRKAATPNHAPRHKRIIRESPLETALESLEAKRALLNWQGAVFGTMGERAPKAVSPNIGKQPVSDLFGIAQKTTRTRMSLSQKLVKLDANANHFGI